MKNKSITLFLALVASVGTMFAESGTCGENVTWDLTNGVLTISGTGEMTDYNDYFREYAPWYSQRSSIISIVINDGVTSIGNYAFAYCTGLTSVTISNTVTEIGFYAFYGCTDLKSIEIPNSVTFIGSYSLQDCSSLTSVTIGSSVTHIDSQAFWGCTRLSSITCYAITPPDLDIKYGVFNDVDKSVCTLYVPAESIDAYKSANGWAEFTNIQAISGTEPCLIASGTCGDNLTWELSCDSVLTISGTGAMKNCKSPGYGPWYSQQESIASVVINEGVTSIGGWAFSKCDGFTSIEIPNSVTSIAYYAFQYCSGLISLEIPSSVTSIGGSAFQYCTGLTSITCEAITPPSASSSTYLMVDKSIPLYVPAESIEAYKAAEGWKDFYNIQAVFPDICGELMRAEHLSKTATSITGVVGGEVDKLIQESGKIGKPDYYFGVKLKEGTFHAGDVYKLVTCSIPSEKIQIFSDKGITMLNDGQLDENGIYAFRLKAETEWIYLYRTPESGIKMNPFVRYVSVLRPCNEDEVYYSFSLSCDTTQGSLTKTTGAYMKGTELTVAATPKDGYTFKAWSDGVTDNPRTITITGDTAISALFEANRYQVIFLSTDGDVIATENVELILPAAPIIAGKSFNGWLSESADSENGIVFRATYTTDNPTTNDDVSITPYSNSAAVLFPFITGALTYELVIRDLFGNVVCKIMFNAAGYLLGVAFAPSSNRAQQQATQTTGFNFTVEGLNANTTYEYEFVANDEKDVEIKTLSGSFKTTADTPQNITNIKSQTANQKYVESGLLFIHSNDRTYDARGQQVK